jgi:hypothetical protein
MGTVKYRRVWAWKQWVDLNGMSMQMLVEKICPAGRAHCSWGDHFVVCVPVLTTSAAQVLPVVGNGGGWAMMYPLSPIFA